MTKKRGRPVGSKNKAKTVKHIVKAQNIDSFSETLKEWDRVDNEVDFRDLCQKLQEALAKSYVEAEGLERAITYWRNEVSARDVVIRYLEGKLK